MLLVNNAAVFPSGRFVDVSVDELDDTIRVNAVAPGAFPTAAEKIQHPDLDAYELRIIESQALPRRGTLEELAAAVSFLAGPESSFVTGQTLNVDGGWVMS
ncbi:MAG TPA: SDR family oxidoreductase [Acidimicrobiia bacterium]|nr:SDR family oxidoreductase [Acidimicrobiia bacterium]